MLYRVLIVLILFVLPFENQIFGEDRVFGGYRKCTSYSYKYKDGSIDIGSKSMSETFGYDEQGKKNDYMQFNIDKPSDTYCCKNPSRGTEYVEAIDLETGKKFIKTSYKYNKVNDLVEKIEFKIDGSIVEVITYKYDTKSREIEQVIYGGNSKMKEKITTKYITKKNKQVNSNTNIKSSDTITNKRHPNNNTYVNYIQRRTCKYDEEGTLIQNIVRKYNELEFEKLTIDEKGIKIQFNDDLQGSSSGKTDADGLDKAIYELDLKERVIAVLRYNSQNIVEDKCEYKYDEFGNTIEKIYYKLGIPIFKTEYVYSK